MEIEIALFEQLLQSLITMEDYLNSNKHESGERRQCLVEKRVKNLCYSFITSSLFS